MSTISIVANSISSYFLSLVPRPDPPEKEGRVGPGNEATTSSKLICAWHYLFPHWDSYTLAMLYVVPCIYAGNSNELQ